MCGIAGIWNHTGKSPLDSTIKSMTDSLAHRGPDGEGYWIDSSVGIALGHRRLSIIDLSQNGHQPMLFQDRYVLTFNGEIYNYLEIKKELVAIGHSFRTESDTEVLIIAYHQWGAQCLSRFDGMFAFALYDREKKELFCARDRFGEKPFFYSWNKHSFSFGSEMKAIFASGVQKEISERLLFLYLNYDVVEDPNNKSATFYANIKQLPAAHFMKVSADTMEIKQYWDLDLSHRIDLSESEANNRFTELFDASIMRRMRSDVPTGASLSGGVDSSSIVASILNLFPDSEFSTFTARFDDENYDEGKHIDLLKQRIPIRTHDCFPSSDQIINELDTIFYHQEEPFGSTSIIAQWEVMKLARANNTVVLLDGQGADETLGGYFKYYLPFLHEMKSTKAYSSQLSAIEDFVNRKPYFNKKENLRMMMPKTFDKMGEITRKYRGSSFSNDLNDQFLKTYKRERSPFHQDYDLNSFLYHDVFNYGLGKLLRFSDRNAMAHGVEVRLPYLSHELVEFVFALNAKHKIWDGWTKRILRRSMENRVPNEILYRRDKKGFQAPTSWLKEKRMLDLIGDSAALLKKHQYIDAPNDSNHWKYIMSAKLIQTTN